MKLIPFTQVAIGAQFIYMAIGETLKKMSDDMSVIMTGPHTGGKILDLDETDLVEVVLPVISDKIIKHIADLGYVQRESDGKIVHEKDKEWRFSGTSYDNMEDLIMSALNLYTKRNYE